MFVHSSLKSVGPVEGGPAAIIAAMREALGPSGTLLMPTFNLVPGGNEGRAKNWNIQTTPSTVGYLTEFFRTMPGSFRSDHFSHAASAQGPKAQWYTEGHLSLEGMESPWDMPPWGKAYGSQSPLIRAYDQDALLLMLGVDYHTSTYTHVVEVMDFNRRRKDRPKAAYFFVDRPMLGAWWDRHGDVSRGKVGQADCRLFSARKYVDALCRLVASQPEYWFKWFDKSVY
jgi:aminoglycoside 3-N-acetyltransferase